MDFQIQSYLRAAASRGRDTQHIGPFLATFTPDSTHPFVNYAIPDDHAQPTAAQVQALTAVYQQRGRVPRLEFLPQVAPAAEAALLAGGFCVEARVPLMTCAAGEVATPPAPEGVELVLAAAEGELAATAAAQHAAFDQPPPGPEAARSLRRTIHDGGWVVLARDARSGEPAGGGLCVPPVDGVVEVAGIGVLPRWRRRGVGAAITARLTSQAFAAGVTTACLTPGDTGAERVYARAGFTVTTQMLHLVLQPAG